MDEYLEKVKKLTPEERTKLKVIIVEAKENEEEIEVNLNETLEQLNKSIVLLNKNSLGRTQKTKENLEKINKLIIKLKEKQEKDDAFKRQEESKKKNKKTYLNQ